MCIFALHNYNIKAMGHSFRHLALRLRNLKFKAISFLAIIVITAAVAGCGDEGYDYEVRTDVPNKAFYKDLFMDTGLWMSAYRTMPVVDYLSLDYEYFFAPEANEVNQSLQENAYCGSEEDLNGVLLYPDGEPRFKIVYVNGGLASYHGRSLRAQGRNIFRRFVSGGGSYIGSCAGAFLASYGLADDNETVRGYLGIWPGFADNTRYMVDLQYDIPEGSPVLQYYDFGGNGRLDFIHHENGPFFSRWDSVEGTEVLAFNRVDNYPSDGWPSVLAYKADTFSGRVIPSGGHPEQVPDGEGRDMMASYVRYAVDGLGAAKVKALLSNGERCVMDKSTADNDPLHTMIGDKQCHHFVFALPKGASDVRIELESLKDCNLSLFLAKGTFAFRQDAQYSVENCDSIKVLEFDKLEEGLWYIAVQSEESVECEFKEHGYKYSGKTWLLNGAPYSICVIWNQKGRHIPSVKIPSPGFTGDARLASGADFNEYVKQLANHSSTVATVDSTIRRIVFKTSDPSSNVTLVSDIRSSIPVYASLDSDGTLTVTTPAAVIFANVDASYMFADLMSLEQIENLGLVNTSSTRFFNDMFNGCIKLEELDISHFDMSKSETTVNMFSGCKLLKRLL